MRVIFIRHGQSREVTASWAETPDLIVTSPYIRTQQTAAPTESLVVG